MKMGTLFHAVDARLECSTPRKYAFQSRADAKRYLKHCQRNRTSGFNARSVYHCPCGLWHLTSQPKNKA